MQRRGIQTMIYEGLGLPRIEFATDDDDDDDYDDYDAYLATFKGSLLFTPDTSRRPTLIALLPTR